MNSQMRDRWTSSDSEKSDDESENRKFQQSRGLTLALTTANMRHPLIYGCRNVDAFERLDRMNQRELYCATAALFLFLAQASRRDLTA